MAGLPLVLLHGNVVRRCPSAGLGTSACPPLRVALASPSRPPATIHPHRIAPPPPPPRRRVSPLQIVAEAMLLSIFGGVLVYAAIIGYSHFFANDEAESIMLY